MLKIMEKLIFVTYVIRNKRTGKFVYGTDKRYRPYRQRTSYNRMLTYENLEAAENDFRWRSCGKDYQIAELNTEVNRLIKPREEKQHGN